MSKSPIKIAFLSGPANVREIYREWSGKEQQFYFGTDYMKQFLQVAKDVGARSYVVTWYGTKRETFQLGDFIIDNRPITQESGVRYYVDHLIWHLRLLFTLIAFRPDVLLLTGNQNFWWILSPLRLLGTKIVISYHAVVWPKLRPRPLPWTLMVKLNGLLILKHARAVLSTSHDIRRQVEEVLGSRVDRVDILDHLPTYAPAQFAAVTPPGDPSKPPFRVFFLGRTETNKGIYDIVQIADELEKQSPGKFRFDLCGSGSELERLRERVRSLGLEDVVHCHGYASPETVRELINASHASIVPTRSDYEAGFEMTCAESILAGRPLITSAVCPALEYMRDASVEARPDDAGSYREALVELSSDPELYERKRQACARYQQQFYDPANSWYAAMRRAFDRHVLSIGSSSLRPAGTKNQVATDAGG